MVDIIGIERIGEIFKLAVYVGPQRHSLFGKALQRKPKGRFIYLTHKAVLIVAASSVKFRMGETAMQETTLSNVSHFDAF